MLIADFIRDVPSALRDSWNLHFHQARWTPPSKCQSSNIVALFTVYVSFISLSNLILVDLLRSGWPVASEISQLYINGQKVSIQTLQPEVSFIFFGDMVTPHFNIGISTSMTFFISKELLQSGDSELCSVNFLVDGDAPLSEPDEWLISEDDDLGNISDEELFHIFENLGIQNFIHPNQVRNFSVAVGKWLEEICPDSKYISYFYQLGALAISYKGYDVDLFFPRQFRSSLIASSSQYFIAHPKQISIGLGFVTISLPGVNNNSLSVSTLVLGKFLFVALFGFSILLFRIYLLKEKNIADVYLTTYVILVALMLPTFIIYAGQIALATANVVWPSNYELYYEVSTLESVERFEDNFAFDGTGSTWGVHTLNFMGLYIGDFVRIVAVLIFFRAIFLFFFLRN